MSTATSQPGFERAEVVTLSPLAADEIRKIAREQRLDLQTTAYLRVGVTGGAASGFSYLLDVTEKVDPKVDLMGVSHGVRIVVDSKSSLYLKGTTIEFRTDERGKGFLFQNPNAQTRPTDAPQ
jgi:iron-sulfur cluster assembly protein